MASKDQQDTPLAERVVKEAIDMGMESPMRDTIVDAVEEAEKPRRRRRRLPMAGALVSLGAAAGYLIGLRSKELVEAGDAIAEMETSEVVEEVTEGVSEATSEVETEAPIETGDEMDSEESGRGRLPRIALFAALVAAGVAVARRLRSGDEEEWEPIEEFETAVGADEDEADAEAGDDEPEGEAMEETDEEDETDDVGAEGEADEDEHEE